MRVLLASWVTLTLLLFGCALGAQAQGEEPIAWEVISDSLQVRELSVSGDSTIYLNGGFGTWVWRRDGPDRFVEINRRAVLYSSFTMLSIGRIFYKSSGLNFSDDYLQTVERAVDDGEVVIEMPSGALVAAVDGRDATRSTDSGDTWTPQPNPVFDTVLGRDLALAPPTPDLPFGRLVMVGLGGAAVSDDDGRTWEETKLAQFFGYDSESVVYSEARGAFYTAMNGPVEDGGSTSGVVRASEDGRVWQTVGRLPADGGGFVSQLAAGQDGSLWAVMRGLNDTPQGEVYRSLDGGASWESVGAFDGEALVGNRLFVEDVVVDSEGRVWVGFGAVGGPRTRGLVVRTVEAVAASGEVEAPGTPSEAVLGAVYPNPAVARAGGTVTVPLALAEPAEVKLSVVNALGQPVLARAVRREAAGPHTYSLDTAGLAPGVYVVRVTVAGSDGAQQHEQTFTVVR